MIYDILKSSILNIWPSLFILVVTLVVVRFSYLNSHNERIKFYQEFWSLIGIIYIILLYQMVTRVDVNNVGGKNLIPFTEILRYDLHSEMFMSNVIGNILLFIPFGFIIATYIRPRKIWTNFFITIIMSSTIEFVQLHIGRSFDIDDIILNTLGSIIGFLIYIALEAIKRHLPGIFKKTWFKNLICIIITICIVIYIMQIMGISLG